MEYFTWVALVLVACLWVKVEVLESRLAELESRLGSTSDSADKK